MKNKILHYLFALIFILGINISAQEKVMVTLNVFQPLPEVSFAAFLTNPFLESTPRILQVIMAPHDKMVIVRGSILWRKVDESSFNELLSYTTKPFTSRNFYNDDFSSIDGIEIEEFNSNDDLLQENLKQGKPSGTYKITVQVFNENMEFQSDATTDLDFLNPAQTLTIIQPVKGERWDVGGVQLTWTEVTGVSEYIIKANIRTSKFESLEEALQKGNPIISNKSVGLRTSVNLREILDRELVGGEELVIQVRALVDGPGGPTVIYSDLVNIYLKGATSAVIDKSVEELVSLVEQFREQLVEQLKVEAASDEGGDSEEGDALEQLKGLLDKIANGEIDFNDLRITLGDGRQLTYPEFQRILEYLRRNPDLITNLNFEEK